MTQKGFLPPFLSQGLGLKNLIIATTLTRFCIAFARIYINNPHGQSSQMYTPQERIQRFLERIWVEVGGTSIMVMSLFGFQDVAHHFLKLKALPDFHLDPALATFDEATKTAFKNAVTTIYAGADGSKLKTLLKDQLYATSTVHAKIELVKDALATSLKVDTLDTKLSKAIDTVLLPFHQQKLWIPSALILGAGILASSLLSGPLVQWVNDSVVSKWTNKHIGSLSKWMGVSLINPVAPKPGIELPEDPLPLIPSPALLQNRPVFYPGLSPYAFVPTVPYPVSIMR
jgi:hypothetical protein